MYKVQNHALDLTIPGGENALLIQVDEKNSASCTHVPRQISKSDLISLLPNSWITDYESLHTQANEPLESSNSRITQTTEGRISISFDHSHLKSSSKTHIPSIMIAEVPMQMPTENGKLMGRYDFYDNQKCFLQDIIAHLDQRAKAIYHFQDPISGHIYFDVCTKCDDCWWEHTYGTSDPVTSRKKKSKPVDPEPFEPRPCKPDSPPRKPDTDNFQSACSSFDGYKIPSSWVYQQPKKENKSLHSYYQKCLDILEKEAREQTKELTQEWKPKSVSPNQCFYQKIETQVQAIPECFMFQETDFPPLESFVKNGSKHTPKIQNVALIVFTHRRNS